MPTECVNPTVPLTEPDKLKEKPLPYHVPVNLYTKRGKAGKTLQAVTLQRVLLHDAMTATNPKTRAALVRAWIAIQDQIRVFNGELKPGSVNESRKGVDTKSDSGLTSFGK